MYIVLFWQELLTETESRGASHTFSYLFPKDHNSISFTPL